MHLQIGYGIIVKVAALSKTLPWICLQGTARAAGEVEQPSVGSHQHTAAEPSIPAASAAAAADSVVLRHRQQDASSSPEAAPTTVWHTALSE